MIPTSHPTAAFAPAQASGGVEAVGGSPMIVFAVFALLSIATLLALLVTYHLVRGYLESGTRPLLLLAVGIFLLTAAPTFLRLLLTNVLVVETQYRILITSLVELAGLFVILYTIYR